MVFVVCVNVFQIGGWVQKVGGALHVIFFMLTNHGVRGMRTIPNVCLHAAILYL